MGGNATIHWPALGKELTLRWLSVRDRVQTFTLGSDPYDEALNLELQATFRACLEQLAESRKTTRRGVTIGKSFRDDPDVEAAFARQDAGDRAMTAHARERAMREHPWEAR